MGVQLSRAADSFDEARRTRRSVGAASAFAQGESEPTSFGASPPGQSSTRGQRDRLATMSAHANYYLRDLGDELRRQAETTKDEARAAPNDAFLQRQAPALYSVVS